MADRKEQIYAALAAVQYTTGKGWTVMFVDQDGKVDFREGYDIRSVRQTMQIAAGLMTDEYWSDRRKRFVRVMADAEAPTRAARRRPPLRPETRWAVLERDGHRCGYCGATADIAKLHIDHRLARSKGGTDDLDNLVTACQDCNLGKSDTALVEKNELSAP